MSSHPKQPQEILTSTCIELQNNEIRNSIMRAHKPTVLLCLRVLILQELKGASYMFVHAGRRGTK